MDWATTALLSATVFTFVSILDSFVLSKRVPNLQTFMLPVSFIYLIYGVIFIYQFPFPEDIEIMPLLAAIAAGVLRVSSVAIMLFNLRSEEVSRVMPIYHTSPVFVAIMAVPLLGESLNYLQWLAIIIVVAGALVISMEKKRPGATKRLGKAFTFLFVASICVAVADISSKYALNHISFWNMNNITMLCLCSVFWILSLRPSTIRSLKEIKHKSSTFPILIVSEALAPIAMGLSYWAMQNGPISLVSTIISTRPVLVAVFSLVLGFIFPGFLMRHSGKETLIPRFIATVMIVGGISIIYLT